MGQYHLTVNLTKREFIDPHKLGDGLKLAEQSRGPKPGGTNDALHLLLAVSNGRGGGDFPSSSDPEAKWIGRWGGDKIAVVGDYGEDSDLPEEFSASRIYRRCRSTKEERTEESGDADPGYTDITDELCKVLEVAYEIVYVGDGWRERVSVWDIENLSMTHAIGNGRVARIGRDDYSVPSVVAALRMAKKAGPKYTLAELHATGHLVRVL